MENRVRQVDDMMDNLIELAYTESVKARTRGFFSKDLAEACGVIASIVYGRYSNNDKSID